MPEQADDYYFPQRFGTRYWEFSHQKSISEPEFATEEDAAPALVDYYRLFSNLPCLGCIVHFWDYNYPKHRPLTSKILMNRKKRVTWFYITHALVNKMLNKPDFSKRQFEDRFNVQPDIWDEEMLMEYYMGQLAPNAHRDDSRFVMSKQGVIDTKLQLVHRGGTLPIIAYSSKREESKMLGDPTNAEPGCENCSPFGQRGLAARSSSKSSSFPWVSALCWAGLIAVFVSVAVAMASLFNKSRQTSSSFSSSIPTSLSVTSR